MYYNKNYQKLGWLLLGFLIASCFISKVHALENLDDGFVVNGVTINNTLIDNIWSNIEGKTKHDIIPSNPDNSYVYHRENLPYMYVEQTPYSGNVLIFFSPTNEFSQWITVNKQAYLNSDKIIRIEIYNGRYYYSFDSTIHTATYSDNYKALTSFDFYDNQDNILINQYFVYSSVSLPDYLNGYKKITLTTDDRYYILSGLSTGSVFIPLEDFEEYGGRLSYYDNDLTSQPFTSYIQDFYKMSDGLFVRQDFDLSTYYGADFVMFSKYIYFEGEDNITYDIWVPDDITYSNVVITPNSSGGNDFEFQYKDSNGDIQNQTTSSVDLTPPQPLLSDVFNNFTTNYYGLSSIILSPISFLEGVNSATCTPLSVPLPYTSNSLTLPCMTPLYQSWFGNLFTLYQTITAGFIAYYVGLGYFNLIKGLKDPSDDRIEVIHL